MTDQDAPHDSPGESSDVTWQLEATTVDATLVRPSGAGPFPAVVMVAGSGPTDRDWNSPLFPGPMAAPVCLPKRWRRLGSLPCATISAPPAHVPARICRSLIGKLSMQSHLDELAGAVRTLASQTYVRDDHIFALANSEGTLHALNYQIA